MRNLLNVLMDYIRDASMIMDYAAEASKDGMAAWSDWFRDIAKHRIDDLNSMTRYVFNEIGLDQRVRDGDELAEALYDHIRTQVESLQRRYNMM